MEIISRKYKEIEILFSQDIDKNLYINATKIAKHFSKTPKDWLKNQDTQSYIEALLKTYNYLNNNILVKVLKGNFANGQEQGTWIHQKLIIAFARWLSPEFAVWCDVQIEEIIKGKTVAIQTKSENLISVSTENMRKEFEALEFTFKHQNFSELEKKKLLNQTLRKINFTNLDSLKEYKETFSLTELLEIFYISILPQDFNRKLKNFGIIKWSQGNWILLDLKFGRNCPFDENSNPRYFKQTFQNLLDIVL